jgi:hypothetical protein
LIKVVGRFLYFRSEAVPTAIKKNPGKKRTTRYRVFCSVIALIHSGSIQSYLAAENVFSYLKGRCSLKKFLIGGNVKEVKAYRLIPLIPLPPRWSFYSTFTLFLTQTNKPKWCFSIQNVNIYVQI